jgi:hypothetical protein
MNRMTKITPRGYEKPAASASVKLNAECGAGASQFLANSRRDAAEPARQRHALRSAHVSCAGGEASRFKSLEKTGMRRTPRRDQQPSYTVASAPPQLEPQPAVQPKQ